MTDFVSINKFIKETSPCQLEVQIFEFTWYTIVNVTSWNCLSYRSYFFQMENKAEKGGHNQTKVTRFLSVNICLCTGESCKSQDRYGLPLQLSFLYLYHSKRNFTFFSILLELYFIANCPIPRNFWHLSQNFYSLFYF